MFFALGIAWQTFLTDICKWILEYSNSTQMKYIYRL